MTFRTILTEVGLALEAAADAAGTPIVLAEMAVGDGNGNPVTPDPTQTFLARERYRAGVNQLYQDTADPTRFIAELVVPASEGGFVIREVGLFTSDGDLYAVGNVPETYKPTASEGAYSDTVVRVVFLVANASVVTLVIDPNVTVATHTWVLNNVTASSVIPGGLTGQVLTKASNADGDTEWTDPGAAVEVVVWSREESQTLAAAQTVVTLAVLNTEGAAYYIDGVRLREDEYTINSETQITLDVAATGGEKITAVQNEEVGTTDILFRANNLSDVPDKPAARANLGIPGAIAAASIAWSQLNSVPAYASRWPTWSEVTSKPLTFAPSAHSHVWSDITVGTIPATATRWPTWTEVTNKPGTFTPASHLHAEYAKLSGDTFTGTVAAPLFAQSSARKYKEDIAAIDPAHALRLVMDLTFCAYTMRATGDAAAGVIADDLVGGPLDAAVIRNEDGTPEAVNYQHLFVMACAALQGLAARVEALEAREPAHQVEDLNFG